MAGISETEHKLKNTLEAQGWNVVRKGWPDFACVKDGEMIFIEVKTYRGEMLKKEQHYILQNLAKQGLECYRWDPVEGFELITPSTPAPRAFSPGYPTERPLEKPYNTGRFTEQHLIDTEATPTSTTKESSKDSSACPACKGKGYIEIKGEDGFRYKRCPDCQKPSPKTS